MASPPRQLARKEQDVSASLLVACLVIGVADGDSLKIKCDERVNAMSIRLSEIDAPEIVHKSIGIREQPGGRESKASLTELCLGQPAVVHVIRTDLYRRTLAKVECAGVRVNAEQVRRGMAWAYMTKKRSIIPGLEVKARADGVGLWAQLDPIKPSVWRKTVLVTSTP